MIREWIAHASSQSLSAVEEESIAFVFNKLLSPSELSDRSVSPRLSSESLMLVCVHLVASTHQHSPAHRQATSDAVLSTVDTVVCVQEECVCLFVCACFELH